MLSRSHIGIIGGGASGVFALCHLIDKKMVEDDLSPLQITLIEKNVLLGEGMAYRGDYTSNVLNTAAGLLSGMDDERSALKNQPSFLQWVRDNYDQWSSYCPELKISDITKNAYLPRCLVGIYLRHLIHFYKNKAPKYHVLIRTITAEAEDMYCDASGIWQVILSDHQLFSFSRVILAIGGFLKKNFASLEQSDYFFENPWPTQEALQKILRCKTVGIMGTKLSALDTVSILTSHQFKGKIVMASRSGFLPSVKNLHHTYKPFLLTTDTLHYLSKKSDGYVKLNDVINLVKTEIDYAVEKKINWEKIILTKNNSFSMGWLLWQIKMAKNPSCLWQSVLAAAGDFFTHAWHLLSESDKHYFNHYFLPTWDIYRFSMPLTTATQVLSLIKHKKLHIISHVSDPIIQKKQFELSGIECVQKNSLSIRTDCLINATGINYDANTLGSPLLKNLLKRQLVNANSFGGIDVDFEKLTVQKNVYVIGDLTKGTYFFTNSYLVCFHQAESIAQDILEEMRRPLYREAHIPSVIARRATHNEKRPRSATLHLDYRVSCLKNRLQPSKTG